MKKNNNKKVFWSIELTEIEQRIIYYATLITAANSLLSFFQKSFKMIVSI
jgi:hypothetical protein